MTNVNCEIWDTFKRYRVTGTQLTITGVSEAAAHTCIYIRELDLMFDCGITFNHTPKRILISHTHWDHINGIGSSLFQTGKFIPDIYFPAGVTMHMTKLVEAIYNVSGVTISRIQPNLIPVKIGTRIPIIISNRPWIIEPIKCIHSVPTTGYGLIQIEESIEQDNDTNTNQISEIESIGYGLISVQDKLKDEYRDFDRKVLGELRRDGITITYTKEVPTLCYLCDTDHRVLSDPSIEKYPNIIIECTFLMDDDIKKAKKDKHIHWKNLEPFVISHPDTTFYLCHFSQRYSREYIRSFFDRLELKNIVLIGITPSTSK